MDIEVELKRADKARYQSQAFFDWKYGKLVDIDTSGNVPMGVVVTDSAEFDFVPLKFLRIVK